MGSAYCALATDAYAPVWNPAGLGFLSSHEIAGQHLSYLESIYDEYLGGAVRLKEGRGLGVSAQYLGSGDIPGADLNGNRQGNYSTHFGAYSVAFGQAFGENYSVGVTGKFLEAKISDITSKAFAADIGAMYKVNDWATIAATLSNVGSKLSFLNDSSSLPLTGRLGAAIEPLSHWLLAVEGDYSKASLLSGHLGVQWHPLSLIAIRAGYRSDTTKELGALAGLTTGIGLMVWGHEFSYAWLPLGDLGATQYFSFVFHFGGAASNNGQRSLHKSEGRPDDRRTQSDDPSLTELLNSTDKGVQSEPVRIAGISQ